MGPQTRRVAFGVPVLCLVLVVSGGWIAFPNATNRVWETLALAARSESRLPPAQDRVNAELPTGNLPSGVQPSSSFWSDPNRPSTSGLHLGNGELFLRLMLSVGLVIALGAGALYLSRKVLPRVARASGKEIRVLETAYLGPRKALHLVEVGSQRLLIASTNDNVTMLALMNEAWLEAPNAEDRVGEPLEMAKPELGEAANT